jgi:hypothetical protein
MIAAAAYPKFLAKDFAAVDFSAEPSLALRSFTSCVVDKTVA